MHDPRRRRRRAGKVGLLTLSVGRFAEMYKPLGAFIEIYAPVLGVPEQVQVHKLSRGLQASD